MIRMRDIKEIDKEKILNWRNMPEVTKYMYTDHLISKDEHEKWFAEISSSPKFKYWIIECDNIDVGLANLCNIDFQNKKCDWAFYVADKSARGKGVGSFVEYFILKYVFDELQFNKLCCEVLDFNKAAINIYIKFGFKQEGLFRNHIIKQGNSYNVIALSMLKEEWTQNRSDIEERLRSRGII